MMKKVKPAASPFTTDPSVLGSLSLMLLISLWLVLTVDMLTGCGMLTWAVPGPDCLLCSCVHLSWDTH